MQRLLIGMLLAVLTTAAPALAAPTAQTYVLKVPVQASHLTTAATKMGVLCSVAASSTIATATSANGQGFAGFTDFMLDSTGSYNQTVTVTIPANAFPNGSYGCSIGTDQNGIGALSFPPWMPQTFITGVTGRLPG